MEESKEIQSVYKIFRTLVYVSLLVEFFVYAMPYQTMAAIGTLCLDFHDRLTQLVIYSHGHLAYSKLATLLLVVITCMGTRNKKHIKFDARWMVFFPLALGIILIVLSVWVYDINIPKKIFGLKTNIFIYMIASVFGTVFIHTALDNISKYLKTGLLDDRFNFENESFEQNTQLVQNKYSVNIPMRFYHKGKFRHGWVNITIHFVVRGSWVHLVQVRRSPLLSLL